MKVVEIAALENGAHRNQSGISFVPEGWAKIPDNLETPKFPFGDITVEYIDGVMTVTSWEGKDPPAPTEEELAKQLEAAKSNAIAKSNSDLEAYLESHPIQWTDGEYYSITQKKQNQLTSKIMAATMAQMRSQPYTLKWNSTGDVCKEWDLEDLSALAFAIDAKVTALVTYQQAKEVEIQACETIEEVQAIVINYDEVA